MTPIWIGSFVCLVSLSVLPSTVSAQDWSQPWPDRIDRPARVDLGASIEFLAPTDWSDLVLLGTISSATGVLEQVLVRDLRVEPNTAFGAAVTYWRGRYGFRTHAAYSSSSLVIGGPTTGLESTAEGGSLVSVDVDTWLYDVRGAIGLLEYAPSRWVWPYAFVGFGGITYNLARTISPPLLTFIEGGRSLDDPGDIVIVKDEGRQFVLAVDELGLETVFAVNAGIGTDFRIPLGPGGVGLRLEISDHIAPSPVGLRLRELNSDSSAASDDAVRFGVVHHLRAAAALVVQIGR